MIEMYGVWYKQVVLFLVFQAVAVTHYYYLIDLTQIII